MTPRGTTSAPTACASSVRLPAEMPFVVAIEVRYANAMHAFLMAVVLFAQTVSVTREAVVDPAAADKIQAQLHDALAPSAREKLQHAGAKFEVKAAREAVAKAFPDAQLSADTV